jgi:acyl carrier protein
METYTNWINDWLNDHKGGTNIVIEDGFLKEGIIDSFGVILLIEDIEQEFSIKLNQKDFQDNRFGSIIGLAEIINEKKSL